MAIEPRPGLLRIWHWQPDALTIRLDLVQNRLDLISNFVYFGFNYRMKKVIVERILTLDSSSRVLRSVKPFMYDYYEKKMPTFEEKYL